MSNESRHRCTTNDERGTYRAALLAWLRVVGGLGEDSQLVWVPTYNMHH